jgi:5'-deoxynucleotidase YfbR-like HD superfamily hydrolase
MNKKLKHRNGILLGPRKSSRKSLPKLKEAPASVPFDIETAPLHPDGFGGSDYMDWDKEASKTYDQVLELLKIQPNTPVVSQEDELTIKTIYDNNPFLKSDKPKRFLTEQENVDNFYKEAEVIKNAIKKEADKSWIQTYSGLKFYPFNPYPDAIVIQDIAHSLSMQCRFSGHCKKFYSVAQHSVLVSYVCDSIDALWGLLHDASETYLSDIPRPLKRSGKMDNYIEFENEMQKSICTRFGLSIIEPPSVKKADTILLATEARDLMSPLHSDWQQPVDPLPFKIEPLPPQEAKNLFMKRFFELKNCPDNYEHYLHYENKS